MSDDIAHLKKSISVLLRQTATLHDSIVQIEKDVEVLKHLVALVVDKVSPSYNSAPSCMGAMGPSWCKVGPR